MSCNDSYHTGIDCTNVTTSSRAPPSHPSLRQQIGVQGHLGCFYHYQSGFAIPSYRATCLASEPPGDCVQTQCFLKGFMITLQDLLFTKALLSLGSIALFKGASCAQPVLATSSQQRTILPARRAPSRVLLFLVQRTVA